MALAIRLDGLLRSGEVGDLTELARLDHVSQPRTSQILNLTLLAPDIQEELLHLPRILEGRDPINEKMLRPIVAEYARERQRLLWRQLRIGGHIDLSPQKIVDGDGIRAAQPIKR